MGQTSDATLLPTIDKLDLAKTWSHEKYSQSEFEHFPLWFLQRFTNIYKLLFLLLSSLGFPIPSIYFWILARSNIDAAYLHTNDCSTESLSLKHTIRLYQNSVLLETSCKQILYFKHDSDLISPPLHLLIPKYIYTLKDCVFKKGLK